MIKMNSLESLPDELLLMILNYLSLYDLCQSFLHVENVRFKSLLQCQSHSLIVNSNMIKSVNCLKIKINFLPNL
jgi:hypothetical protein